MSSMQVTDELLYRYAPMAENLWISQLPSDEQIPVYGSRLCLSYVGGQRLSDPHYQ